MTTMNNGRDVRLGVVAACVLAGTAVGQWTAEDLHPEWMLGSMGTAVWEDGAAGDVFTTDTYLSHGAVWFTGVPGWVDLSQEGTFRTTLSGAHGGVFGGSLHPIIQEPEGACYWRGASADSVVRLHPEAAWRSMVQGVWGQEQVGWADFPEGRRACLWKGSAATLVELSPPGLWSEAMGVWDGEQVGSRAVPAGRTQAALWHGSAASWVNLAPAGSYGSEATAVYAGTQVGWVQLEGGVPEAAMWQGGPGTWVSLAPAGSVGSYAYAAGEGVQAGFARIGDVSRAGVWFGSASSWVDLHAVLPQGYSWSQASAVWSDGDRVRVMGSAEWDGDIHAVLWTGRVPAGRASDFNGDGFIDFFDYDAFVSCFEGAGCPAGRTADFDGDGFTDYADYGAFVAAFEAGA